jgi:hypothetical protein
MPTNSDFKRLVRARMAKTGEAYTAARAKLLSKSTRTVSSPPPQSPPPPPEASRSLAKLAGMSDAAVEKATGCPWDQWVFALDRAGAQDWSHRAIAEHVQSAYKVPDWWAQTVTVGYERIKGIREIGQRRSGTFEANKSKTIKTTAAAASRAFTDGRIRRKWLPDVTPVVKKATAGKSVRMTWSDGTPVEVWLVEKTGGKVGVQIQHRKLPGRAEADRLKAFWAERLAALNALLQS